MENERLNKDATFDIDPQSYWLASTQTPDYPVLSEDIEVDVAIVGGGMVGITTGLLLKEAGLKVAILEADAILQGTTGHTTAKITSQHDLIYDKLKTQMGVEKAQMYASANETAIKFIANQIKNRNIDCDFEWQPNYLYTQSDQYIEQIQQEVRTASSLGIKADYLEEIPLPFPIKAAIRFNDQAQFHPRKYLLALAKEIPGDGSHIFHHTRVIDIKEGEPNIVLTKGGYKVTAPRVIVASHYPFYDMHGLYFARIYPERSYALGVTIKEKFPKGMYINAEDPARSLRSQRFEDGELIIVGGDHHKTGHGPNTIEHYHNLRVYANETFTVKDILYRWSTQDCMTLDKVPYIGQLGPTNPNIYVATGFGKWGMTSSTVSAILLRDLIVKGENPWSPVYSPQRFTPMASAVNFFKENTDVALSLISGKLTPGSYDKEVKGNEGKVLEIDGNRVGAYRDGDGKLHLVDTTCTHMGCELDWNDAETTWDCPCHGSRFTCDGDIVEGPTTKPLKKIQEEQRHFMS